MDEAKCEFYADPIAGGRITPRALLSTTGTITLPLARELLVNKVHCTITRLAGLGWYFNIGYFDGKFIVQRNGAQIAINEEWCSRYNPPEEMAVSWREDALILSFGNQTNHWNYEQLVEFSPLLAPPPPLVKWIRTQELRPIETFESEEQFLIRVHSALQRFDERIRPILNRGMFWDMTRKGNKIISQKPKREVEIQSIIHALLVDQMQVSNIDIYPEAKSSAGAVDFLFVSALKNGVIAKICVEFKNAHSADLIRGLSAQLRAYMKTLEVENGAYCVLDYRGADFSHPHKTTNLTS